MFAKVGGLIDRFRHKQDAPVVLSPMSGEFVLMLQWTDKRKKKSTEWNSYVSLEEAKGFGGIISHFGFSGATIRQIRDGHVLHQWDYRPGPVDVFDGTWRKVS